MIHLSLPALSPARGVCQFTPGNQLCSTADDGFQFDPFYGLGGGLRFYHQADQEMLFPVLWAHCSPFAEQQFFGIECVMG